MIVILRKQLNVLDKDVLEWNHLYFVNSPGGVAHYNGGQMVHLSTQEHKSKNYDEKLTNFKVYRTIPQICNLEIIHESSFIHNSIETSSRLLKIIISLMLRS